MKTKAILAMLALSAAPGLWAKTPAALDFAEKKYDFGTVKETSAPVVHEYKFVNTADEPVALLSVTTGCGCTKADYPARPIAAGDSASVKVTFVPAGMAGSVSKSINVRYRWATAKSAKRLTLRLNGTVTK